jgi:NADPH-dependent 2,4-dienoyl-CoA reductase/sulfur reductase-like enzyme
MARRLVVIGGGAAGMSAASAARRVDRDLEVVVLEAGGYAAYGMCGLPYYLGGEVEEAEQLLAYPPQFFAEKRGIDLRLNTAATGLDVEQRRVRFRTGAAGTPSDCEEHKRATSTGERTEQELGYDRLVMAAGGIPVRPQALGLDDPGVFTVRSLADAVRLRGLLEAKQVTTAVVVGAGYIGLEMAEALAAQGVDVTVVEAAPVALPMVDPPMSEMVAEEVRRHGVELCLGATVTGLSRSGERLVVAAGAAEWVVDLVVVAVGVRPAVGLVAAAGAATGPAGALLVDDRMRTSLPDVFAAGDCIAVHHRVLDGPAYVPLGPAANKTGQVAGIVAAGGDARFPGVVGTAVVKVFDLTVALTGLSLAEARAAGMVAEVTESVGRSRAKYYPGASPVTIRLVHGAGGRLLGAQMAGRDPSVAKRIDALAVALHAGLGLEDLAALDLSYAPPYAPVYEPVLLAARSAVPIPG